MSTPPNCPQLAGLTNLATVSYAGAEVWCYMLDSSHPDVLATIGGTCGDYYVTSANTPGGNYQCVFDTADNKCKGGTVFICANTPPLPPSPSPPPPPKPPPPPPPSPPPHSPPPPPPPPSPPPPSPLPSPLSFDIAPAPPSPPALIGGTDLGNTASDNGGLSAGGTAAIVVVFAVLALAFVGVFWYTNSKKKSAEAKDAPDFSNVIKESATA